MIDRNGICIVRSLIHPDSMINIVTCNYDLPLPIKCKIMSIGDNDSYLILAGEHKYFLRIYVHHKHWEHQDSDYRFELECLTYLHVHNLPVSYPVARRDGDIIGTLNAPEGLRRFALFSFAEGQVDLFPTDTNRLFIFGENLAKIHLALNGFKPQHRRFEINLDFLLYKPLERINNYLQSIGRQHDVEYLATLAEKLAKRIAYLPMSGDEYSIIIGDCHASNHHFTKDNKINFFDFDLCGYGWCVYDLAVYIWYADKRTTLEKVRVMWNVVLKGYQSIRPLSPAEIEAIFDFIQIRQFWLMGEHVADIDTLGIAKLNDEYWDKEIGYLKLQSSGDLKNRIADYL